MKWIVLPTSWGGGIEAQILAEYLSVVISIINIKSNSITDFGENNVNDSNFSSLQRMMFIYDGIHYDPLYVKKKTADGHSVKYKFPLEDTEVVAKALEFAKVARSEKKFTDLSAFSLKCGVCNKSDPLLTQRLSAFCRRIWGNIFKEVFK